MTYSPNARAFLSLNCAQLACRVAIVCAALALAPAAAWAQADVEPPQLTQFSIAPPFIDVTGGDQTVTVTMHVTDNLVGIDDTNFNDPPLQLNLGSLSGGQLRRFSDFTRISGTANDGIWQGSVIFPEFSEAGTWRVNFVSLSDAIGNNALLDTEALKTLGFLTDLDVVSVPDTTPPALLALSFAPSPLDVTTGAQPLTVTMRVTDAQVGVNDTFLDESGVQVSFGSPSGDQNRSVSTFVQPPGFTRISGTANDGIWQGSVIFPEFSEAGTWRVNQVGLADAIGNQAFLDAAAIEELGLPTTFTVISPTPDVAGPQLVDFSLSPILIDTTGAAQPLTVTIRVTDTPAGVNDTNLDQSNLVVLFRSPSGGQLRNVFGFNHPSGFTRISGDANDGTYQGGAEFPQFSENGDWRVDFIFLTDAIGNIGFFDTAGIEALGFTTKLIVVQPSLTPDGTLGSAGGTVMDTQFQTTAEVAAPPGVLPDGTDVAIDVFKSPLDLPTPTGFSAPGTNFVNIELNPEPAFPLPAPGLTVTLPLIDFLAPGTSLDLFRVDPGTGQLVPALDTLGNPITGTVDPLGLSATFIGISELSTIVALLPDNIIAQIDIKPGGEPNSINRNSRGSIPVAILSTASFDASSDVMIPLLTFGRTGNEQSLAGCGQGGEDVNGDGLADLVCHFFTNLTGFQAEDTEGILKGETIGGTPIEGSDSVRIVGR